MDSVPDDFEHVPPLTLSMTSVDMVDVPTSSSTLAEANMVWQGSVQAALTKNPQEPDNRGPTFEEELHAIATEARSAAARAADRVAEATAANKVKEGALKAWFAKLTCLHAVRA